MTMGWLIAETMCMALLLRVTNINDSMLLLFGALPLRYHTIVHSNTMSMRNALKRHTDPIRVKG